MLLPTRLLIALLRITGDNGFWISAADCSGEVKAAEPCRPLEPDAWLCLEIFCFFCAGMRGLCLMVSASATTRSQFGRFKTLFTSSLARFMVSEFSWKARPPFELSKFSRGAFCPEFGSKLDGCDALCWLCSSGPTWTEPT